MRCIGIMVNLSSKLLPCSALFSVIECIKQFYKFSGSYTVAVIWSDIIEASLIMMFALFCNYGKIGKKRFKHMLVRTRRIRIANNQRLCILYCAYAVRNDT